MARWWWRRALVTGASSGIGQAIAERLADEGVAVEAVARRGDRLDVLAAGVRRRGGRCEPVVADLADADDRARVESRLGDPAAPPVDLLVNNAGFGSAGRVVDLDRDREAAMVELNCLALLRLTHAALPGMLARRRGAVLNVSSIAGFQPQPYGATYAATKAFVTSWSQAVREEVRGQGVTVTALCPGSTPTEFSQAAGAARGSVPAALQTSVGHVAAAGLAGAAAGRAVVVPGAAFKVAAAVSGVLPTSVTRRLATRTSRRRLPDGQRDGD